MENRNLETMYNERNTNSVSFYFSLSVLEEYIFVQKYFHPLKVSFCQGSKNFEKDLKDLIWEKVDHQQNLMIKLGDLMIKTFFLISMFFRFSL